jgi:DNA invertase Pin-like site-specific DNA recombinase
MTQMNGKAVAIYVRVNGTGPTNNKKAINDQLTSVRSFVEAGGGNVCREYAESAVGASDEVRPAYQQMLEDARNGHFEIVAIYNLSRLFRDPKVLQQSISDLKQRGVDVISMTTATSGLIFGLFGDANCRT